MCVYPTIRPRPSTVPSTSNSNSSSSRIGMTFNSDLSFFLPRAGQQGAVEEVDLECDMLINCVGLSSGFRVNSG